MANQLLESPPLYSMEAPKHWDLAPPKPMQKERFFASGAEVSVACFPGQTGTLLQNVNRWLAQLKRASITEAELPHYYKKEPLGKETATWVRLEDEKAQNGLLVVTFFARNHSWFFKLEGPVEAIKAEEAAFCAWLKSFSFKGQGAQVPLRIPYR